MDSCGHCLPHVPCCHLPHAPILHWDQDAGHRTEDHTDYCDREHPATGEPRARITASPGVQHRAAVGPPTPGLPRLPCPRHTGDSHSAATDSQLVYDVAKLMEVSRELANVVDSRKLSEEYEVRAQWFAFTMSRRCTARS